MDTDILARLRDVALPPPPSSAPIWPLAVLICCILLGGILLWMVLARWRNGWSSEAIAALDRLRMRNSTDALVGAAIVLRRIALLKLGPRAARLSGLDWLRELDRLFHTRFFTAGDGRAFGDRIYAPDSVATPAAPLIADLSRLLRRRSLLPW